MPFMSTHQLNSRQFATVEASTNALFQPITIGQMSLRNRLVMAPMTRRFSPGGVPTAANRDYYARRAQGGTGLIITEGTWIDHPAAHGHSDIPMLYGDDALAGWKQVVDAVHAAGARILPQLWHLGIQRSRPDAGPGSQVATVSPSGVDAQGRAIGDPLSTREIEQLIDAYARSAAVAQQAGFDGVELHAAHGYLIDQFLWERTNRRTDAYGGSIGARGRFAVEVIEEIRRRCGTRFVISVRLSQWKQQDYDARLAESAAEWCNIVEPIARAGADILHLSTRRYQDPAFSGSDDTLACITRRATGCAVITVGSVGLAKPKDPGLERASTMYSAVNENLDELLMRLERGDFDLVALGRALLANPAWPELVRSGRSAELRPYTAQARDTLT